ncbi:unnamed protein product [Caenorhabditis sp. 36 PRJEB53466]|nr:unnamed protein product [Caenorhabditis sp. 36 PRJEB53466]
MDATWGIRVSTIRRTKMGDKKPTVNAAPAPAPAPTAPSAAPFQDAGVSTLMNKPGEPPFKLALSLNKIEFKCADDRKPVCVLVKLHNPTADLVSYKIRCTSADIFRVQPPIGLVKANETVVIGFWYQNQDKKDSMTKNHYFAFYHTRSDGRQPRDQWLTAKIEGVRRLPAFFLTK